MRVDACRRRGVVVALAGACSHGDPCAGRRARKRPSFRMPAHAICVSQDRCTSGHRDGRRSVRTVPPALSEGSPGLRSSAQSGLHDAENPGPVRSTPTVGVHLRRRAGDVHASCRCVPGRSRRRTRTSRKTACFMYFFERCACHACVPHRIDGVPVRDIRRWHRGFAPGNVRVKVDRGVDSGKNRD